MIRHLFTLIWNRKRANFLLVAEIFFAFVVLFVLGSLLVDNNRKYTAPLGFTYEHVWQIDMDPNGQPISRQDATFQRLMQHLKAMPGVRSVAATRSNTPFSFSDSSTEFKAGSKSTSSDIYSGGDDMQDVLSLELAEGRWFTPRDEVATRPPLVISQEAREALFANEPALGKIVRTQDDQEFQVVGVLATPYRGRGEFQELKPAIFRRSESLVDPKDSTNFDRPRLLIRVQPTATAELEQRITKEVAAVTGGWKTTVTTLPEQRATRMKLALAPMGGMVLVCGFLIFNVALGLFGVLWYNISQRRAEIGLRRAIGATGSRISAQFLGEVMVVTTFGLAFGLLVAAQFPLLGVMGIQLPVYLASMGLATILIYVLTAICAFYPSRLAAGVRPAVALREE
ncbi:ABC transporter permease [Hymenobacter psychrotolerans]|uniref:Putative ABC transport system permease protein n=1 Tax=Hymenobacter psychrotolerans DSM 18569 TaxID=1121959 RepID=A0A1M7FFM8_9BACT|nr:ABC transporter permease [Hymenobacter psychrotolerans]SHM02457.1 putative ABC transport system permease protein [Hymenobacter psychrotolerans DSM 18569]